MTRRRPSRVREAIVAALVRADSLTQADLAAITGVRRQKIGLQLWALLQAGTIAESRGPHERPARYRLRPQEDDHA